MAKLGEDELVAINTFFKWIGSSTTTVLFKLNSTVISVYIYIYTYIIACHNTFDYVFISQIHMTHMT